jgi:hypothetical protein
MVILALAVAPPRVWQIPPNAALVRLCVRVRVDQFFQRAQVVSEQAAKKEGGKGPRGGAALPDFGHTWPL